jgi:hypothetical protein
MIYTSIANVPDSLRGFISTCVEENYHEFEGLKKDYEAAVRNRQFSLASHISQQLGEHMQPSNPAITIVGGSGGYILVDEKRLSLARV